MEFLVIGDIHFISKHNYRESGKNIGEVALKALHNVFTYAEQRGIQHIFHLGDLTDKSRPSEDTRSLILSGFKRFKEEFPDITFHTLIGNHDINRVLRYNQPLPNTALNNFNLALDNFNVVSYDSLSSLDFDNHTRFHTLPYFTYEEDFKRCLKECANTVDKQPDKTHILMFHQDLVEDIPMSTITAADPLFDKFDYIFDGHLHNFTRLSNKFVLVGSFIVNSVNDLKSPTPKGFFHVSTEANKPVQATFIPHEYKYPTFKDVPFNDPIPLEYKGQFIRRYRELEDININASTLKLLTSKDDLVDHYCDHENYSPLVRTKLKDLVDQLQLVSSSDTKVTFKNVTLEGFRSVVSPITFSYTDFKHNINYVIGDVGSGKTSVLIEGLIWCLYGKIQRDPKNTHGGVKNIIPYDHVQGAQYRGTRVMVEFTIEDTDYLVVRHLKFKGKTFDIKGHDQFLVFRKSTSEIDFTYDHVLDLDKVITIEEYPYLDSMTKKARNTKQLEILLGISYGVFVNSIVFGIEADNLVKASSGELSVLLERLLDASWIDDLKVLSTNKYKEHREQQEKVELEETTNKTKLEALVQEKTTLETLLQEFKKNKEDSLKVYTNEINRIRKDMCSNITEARKLAKECKEIPEQELKSMEELIQKKNTYTLDYDRLRNFKVKQAKNTELVQLRRSFAVFEKEHKATLKSKTEEQNRIESLIQPVSMTVSELMEERDKVREVISILTKNKKIYEEKRKEKEEKENVLKEVNTRLNSEYVGICPACEQPKDITREQAQDLRKADEDLKKTIIKDLAQLNQALQSSSIGDLEDEFTKTTEAYSYISENIELTKSIEKSNKIHNDLVQDLKDKIIILDAEYATHFTQVQKLEAECATLNTTVVENYADPDTLEQTIKTQLVQVQHEIDTLESYNENVTKDQTQRANLQKKLQTLGKELNNLRNSYTTVTLQLKSKKEEQPNPTIQKRLHEIKQDQIPLIDKLGKQQKDLKELRYLVSTYQIISSKVCAKKGLKSFIIANRIKKLNDHCINYAQYSNIVVEVQVNSNGTYSIVVYKDGYTSPACNLSGGESMAANLSLICALHDTVQETTGIPLMLLDEPFNHVRETNTDLIQEILDIKASKGTDLFIITHLTDVSNQYQRISFYKDKLGHTNFELS